MDSNTRSRLSAYKSESASCHFRDPVRFATKEITLSGTGDRGFESTSLQQTVRLSPASVFEGREPRLSARVCAAGLATGSAETRKVYRFRANRRQYLCRVLFHYRSAADVVARNATLVPTKSWPCGFSCPVIFELGSGSGKAERDPLLVPGKRQTRVLEELLCR